MKKIVFKNEIDTNKMFVFLCGSYYRSAKDDKRNIIKTHINLSSNLYPIVIDKAFNIDGFTDKTLNVSLMEEIVAKIAHYTIVIVESFSSSAELGLFSSSGKNNQLIMVYANPKDIENNKIGYFIENAFQSTEPNNQYVSKIVYRPAITRVAHNSNWIDEYYYFPKDEIPTILKDSITKISEKDMNKFHLEISSRSKDYNIPIQYNEIKYIQVGVDMHIKVSTFLLFNLCMRLLLNDNPKLLNDKKINELNNNVRQIIVNTLVYQNKHLKKYIKNVVNINYVTELNNEFDDLIKHIAHIIRLFVTDKNLDYFEKTYRNIDIIEEIPASIISYTIFDELDLSPKTIETPNKKNVEKVIIVSKNKKREIFRYSDNENGELLRNTHDLILGKLKAKIHFNSNSYAYKEKTGIKDFLSKHIYSRYFIKFDIKNFFNTIKRDVLASQLNEHLDIKDSLSDTNDLIDSSFIRYDDNYTLPLGFTISPILSEIYMTDFDDFFTDYSIKNEIKYTRYADDICFSSYKKIDFLELEKNIKTKLGLIGLIINEAKVKKAYLRKTGDHIRMLGVNLVVKENQNELELTVGRKYINKLANEILGNSKLNYSEKEYVYSRIKGKIGFLRYINNKDEKRLVKLINLYNVQEEVYEVLKTFKLIA